MSSNKNTGTKISRVKISSQLRPAFIQIAIFSFFVNLLMLTMPLYMMQVFNRVVPTKHLETLFFLTLIAGVAVLVYGLLEGIRSRSLIRVGGWVSMHLKPEIIEACLNSTANGIPVGKRPLDEVDFLKTILASQATLALFDLPWFPIFIAVIWMIHPSLGLAALGAGLLIFSISAVSHILVQKRLPVIKNLLVRSDRFVTATIQGAPSVIGMCMGPEAIKNWQELNSDAATEHGKTDEVTATFSALIKAVRLFVQIALLGFGAYLAVQGEITMGSIVAVSILSGRALAPIDIMVGSWKQIVHARDALKYLKIFLNENRQTEDKISLPPPTGALDVQNASLVLPGMRRTLLNQISFSLKAGETLAIIGSSGAGKSTLCKAILGYHKLAAGNIRLDGADIGRWRGEDLAPHIGYLPQRGEFLPGSIRDNIARFQVAEDHDVIEAAQLAGIHEMILALPSGYETEMEADGSPLSGGQAQRLGLARAIYRKPRLIVLDEPNSSLDGAGARALIGTLNSAQDWGASIIMVMHRPNMVQGIDKILVLRDGRVELFGPSALVMEKLSTASAA